MAKLPARNEIDPKYRWDLTHIFAAQADWEAALKACEEKVKTVAAFEGKVAEDPRRVIRAYFAFQDELMPVIEYAFLSREGDNGDPEAQAMFMRAESFLFLRELTTTRYSGASTITDRKMLRFSTLNRNLAYTRSSSESMSLLLAFW